VRSYLRWLPALQTLITYERGWLRHDLVAGLALSAFLSVGMGYAEASGLPAVYDLYATIVPLAVYGLLGPSRILVLDPDPALAPLIDATSFRSRTPIPAGRLPRRHACDPHGRSWS
jgi:MFS superfamily sulfate permease-like transporter